MAKGKIKALRTMSVNENGFWRGGVRHTRAAQDFPLDRFTKEQADAIRDEQGKMLLVQEVEIDVPAEADKSA